MDMLAATCRSLPKSSRKDLWNVDKNAQRVRRLGLHSRVQAIKLLTIAGLRRTKPN